MSLYLLLVRGHDYLAQDSNEWACSGPTIGPLSRAQITYRGELTLRGRRAVLERFFPGAAITFHAGMGEHTIQLAGGSLPYGGKSYSRWEIRDDEGLRTPSAQPLTPVCDVCGSADLVKDAAAVWDRDRQEWSLLSTYDSITCQRCEREGDAIERWVPNEDAPPVALGEPELDLEPTITTEAEGEGEREGRRD